MPASLIITNSGVPGVVPTPGMLTLGELSLNWADAALYFKDISGDIRAIPAVNNPQIGLTAEIPTNEGPWVAQLFAGTPANTAYVAVQKTVGTLPRIKIGSITIGSNLISVSGTDITISVLAGTTTNAVKALIDEYAPASSLVYFYNDYASDGTGVITPDPIGSATFIDVNAIGGTRSDIQGQTALTSHSDGTYSEWGVVSTTPTKWMPRTPGIIYNRTLSQWERTFVETGSIQTEILPDQ